MIHRIRSLSKLYDDTIAAQERLVDGIAVDILRNVEQAIVCFEENWKGIDAGKHIQDLVLTYNSMIEMRNNLALICAGLTKVIQNYKKVKDSLKKPINEEELKRLRYKKLPTMEEYSDKRDIIDINESVLEGVKKIDIAKSALDIFNQEVHNYYNLVTNNWLEGSGREQMVDLFESFINKLSIFEEALSNVVKNVQDALNLYNSIH